MNNELNKHKNSDKLKWWLTLIAFLLMGVTIGGMLLGYISIVDGLEFLEMAKLNQEISYNRIIDQEKLADYSVFLEKIS